MPIYLFISRDEAGVPANHLQRVVIGWPGLHRPTIRRGQQIPQQGRPPVQAQNDFPGTDMEAWNFVRQQGYLIWSESKDPNKRGFDPHVLTGSFPQNEQPRIFAVQRADPVTSPQFVDSGTPVGSPVGNRGQDRPEGERNDVGFGKLPDSALPGSSSDGIMSETSEAGGTYTEIQANQDGKHVEVKRADAATATLTEYHKTLGLQFIRLGLRGEWGAMTVDQVRVAIENENARRNRVEEDKQRLTQEFQNLGLTGNRWIDKGVLMELSNEQLKERIRQKLAADYAALGLGDGTQMDIGALKSALNRKRAELQGVAQ